MNLSPTIADILYAETDGHRLVLDLYLPPSPRPPLLIWVHGGAWREGSKAQVPVTRLLDLGWGIASIAYRLSTVAPFPAQLHDLHAAIRFLRGESASLGFEAERLAIAGESAGGHLALLAALTARHPHFCGNLGHHPGESSTVQAAVSFYGPTHLTTILSQSTPHGLNVRIPALQLLLGAQPEDAPDLAHQASPVTHVDEKAPPVLLIHGDQDPQVPVNQSLELMGVYQARGHRDRCQLEWVHGAAHGGEAFYEEARMRQVDAFLRRHLFPDTSSSKR